MCPPLLVTREAEVEEMQAVFTIAEADLAEVAMTVTNLEEMTAGVEDPEMTEVESDEV